jgi:hypothetical protein
MGAPTTAAAFPVQALTGRGTATFAQSPAASPGVYPKALGAGGTLRFRQAGARTETVKLRISGDPGFLYSMNPKTLGMAVTVVSATAAPRGCRRGATGQLGLYDHALMGYDPKTKRTVRTSAVSLTVAACRINDLYEAGHAGHRVRLHISAPSKRPSRSESASRSACSPAVAATSEPIVRLRPRRIGYAA